MSNVVIVVDMQRGFLEEGNPLFCGEEARQIIPNVQKLLEEEVARGSTLLFTADTHDPDDKEFQMFPPHCVRGSAEAEIIPELSEFVEKGTVISKNRYSGFFGTDMEERLAKLAPDKLIVCGVCTDICVMHTVADARNRDYAVEVPRDCVASFDPEMHEFALKHIEKVLGAKVK
ncbi:MAG TPA: cysteine hydrolase [Anaerolineae bacterium]|nr:cysteine hydrolase [Anaerolineae bacterium]